MRQAASRRGNTPVRAGVTSHKVDASDADALTELLRGADRCFGTIGVEYTKWPERFPPIIVGLLAACKATRTPLVWCDNLYMYGPQAEPLREDMHLTAYGRKPAMRALFARQMQAHHDAGHSPVAMVRASDFYGPLVRQSLIGEGVVDKLIAGQPALLLPNPDLPHTFTYVVDLARALVVVGDDPQAFGRPWHVPNAPPLSARQVVAMVAAEAGVKPKARLMPSWLLTTLAPFMPIMREVSQRRMSAAVHGHSYFHAVRAPLTSFPAISPPH